MKRLKCLQSPNVRVTHQSGESGLWEMLCVCHQRALWQQSVNPDRSRARRFAEGDESPLIRNGGLRESKSATKVFHVIDHIISEIAKFQ